MIVVATCFWEPNRNTKSFSECYDESWVEKLYNGFNRNLTRPFRFVLFTDRQREFGKNIEQMRLLAKEPDYGCMIEPFRLNVPTIIVGLDTVIVRNIDHLAGYCETQTEIALPRDPYQLQRSINGVALVPRGNRSIFDDWQGGNDMEHLRRYPCSFIDDLWPGHVVSLKAHDVRGQGLRDARIVYMHGEPKADALGHLDWIKRHWR